MMIYQSIPEQVISGLAALTENKYVLLIIVVFVLLVLGCFMEGIAVMVITIPIFMKIIDQFQIDPIQFGVIMVLCSMIGLLTPPVGMSLYAVATISDVSIGRLTRELYPYLLGIFIVTLIITYIPIVSLWLPNILTAK
jgi:C4-dicarboxylate transporter DctM subunit